MYNCICYVTLRLFWQARTGDMGQLLNIFLYAVLFFTWTTFFFTNFNGRRSMGLHSIIIYLTFMIFCILVKVEIMHSYDTDHFDD